MYGDMRPDILIVKILLIAMLVQLGVISYVFITSYQGRVDTVRAQRAGCERSKLDRKDNADFQVAHRIYIHNVTQADSVKEDVKSVARTAVETFDRTSASLAKRAKIDCTEAFPKASLFP